MAADSLTRRDCGNGGGGGRECAFRNVRTGLMYYIGMFGKRSDIETVII